MDFHEDWTLCPAFSNILIKITGAKSSVITGSLEAHVCLPPLKHKRDIMNTDLTRIWNPIP